MKYKIIDNATGIIRETNNTEAYNEIVEDLKACYTKIEYVDVDTTRKEPFYIITSVVYEEGEKIYNKTIFDIRK